MHRDVKGYEGLYYVTEFGSVYSYTRNVYNPATGDSYVKQGQEMSWEITKFGYARVILCKNGKSRKHPVHRLVAIAYYPNPENKPQVNHIDGNKLNNHKDNLEWNTASENTQHAFDTGLNKGQKLWDDEIRKNILSEYKYKSKECGIVALGLKYGLSKSTIYSIIKGG